MLSMPNRVGAIAKKRGWPYYSAHPSLRSVLVVAVALWCATVLPTTASAYSVLTHEEIVDMLWLDEIVPLLRQRFPTITDAQLKEAHAYAYGGAVLQDMGYYPFGSKQFSDMVHYVRSGDFVTEMVADARDPDEFAFALGALSHYVSDVTGHPAVNRSVAIEYPELKRRFGPVVTYDEDMTAHLKTEFGFDVVQVAKQRYTFDQYHSFIGFEVSKPALERAFERVYGLKLERVLKHEDLAIGTLRWSVSKVIPEMTKVALVTRGKQLAQERQDFSRNQFLYHVSRSDYEREWGTKYLRPGVGARMLAILLKLVPRVGPFKALKYKDPTPQTEDLYYKSVDATVNEYRQMLRAMRGSHTYRLRLQDRDLDTGAVTQRGEYPLSDETHAELALELRKEDASMPEDERRYLGGFFSAAAVERKSGTRKLWKKADEAIRKLEAAGGVPMAESAAGRASN